MLGAPYVLSFNLSSEKSDWTTRCLELPGVPNVTILNNTFIQQILYFLESGSLILRSRTGWWAGRHGSRCDNLV